MVYGSVCSGIECATVAWHPLGWTPAWFSEIEPFPCRLLAHYYPTVPNLGDMLKLHEKEIFQQSNIDVLVGGTPCQSFSTAGLRAGLDSPNGNLALQFCRILTIKRPRWFVWENVPGVFSSKKGEDFRSILCGFSECGYSCAWRVLDAKFFGVPQRRRRVFVVGYLGNDWRPPAAVLFEPEGLRRDIAPGSGKGKAVAALTKTGVGTCGADDNQAQAGHIIVGTIDASDDGKKQNLICWSIMPMNSSKDYKAREVEVSQPITTQQGISNNGGDIVQQFPQGFQSSQSDLRLVDTHATLDANNGPRQHNGIINGSIVRRLTPLECERLQGFPEILNEVFICVDEKQENALFAEQNLLLLKQKIKELVAVHVQTNSVQSILQIHNAEKLLLSVNGAEKEKRFPLPMATADFVHLLALMPSIVDRTISYGKEELPDCIKLFSQALNGNGFVRLSGQDIKEFASDVESGIAMVKRLSKSIMSEVGLNIPVLEQFLKIWSSFVTTAINSFIPDEIKSVGSYWIRVSIPHGYTAIPGAVDTPRYEAIGNSMAVPVMYWIGQRIDKVDKIFNK